jgi:syntaxin 16
MMMTSASTFTPTTRSRTLLFISYRDSSVRAPRTSRSGRQYEDSYHPTDEHEGLINHQGGTTSHISLDVELPPKWFVRSEPRVSEIFPFFITLLACLGSTMLNR